MTRSNQRRILLSLLAVVGFSSTPAWSADKVAWRTDLKAAAREAAESGKPMLLKFTADWCTYCHKMERTTYSEKAIVDHVNRQFVPVKVDSDQNEELTKSLGIRALPTTVVVSSDMKVLSRIKGYKTADVLGKELASVVPVEHEVVAAKPNGAAFGGYCLVTLRNERQLVQGDAKITKTFRNKTIAFASKDARDEFEENPVRFWPAWDGNCPVTAVKVGETIEGVPSTGAVYRDRLWFFADVNQRRSFDDAPANFLPTVANTTPRDTRRN